MILEMLRGLAVNVPKVMSEKVFYKMELGGRSCKNYGNYR